MKLSYYAKYYLLTNEKTTNKLLYFLFHYEVIKRKRDRYLLQKLYSSIYHFYKLILFYKPITINVLLVISYKNLYMNCFN